MGGISIDDDKSYSSSTSSSSSSSSSSSQDVREHEKSDAAAAEAPAAASHAATPSIFPERKGSRPRTLPTSSLLIRDNKSSYYHLLERRGRRRIRDARALRKKARQSALGDATKLDPTLESSSSESESDSGGENVLYRETMDWEALAHDSWCAEESLFSVMPVSEVSSLVGWATHQLHDGSPASIQAFKCHQTQEEQCVQEKTSSETCHETNPATSDASEYENPLLFLPNTPLPPSYLQHLSNLAASYIEQTTPNRYRWSSQTYLASSDASDEDEKKPRSSNKKQDTRLDWQVWEYDDKDETYQAARESLKKRKRLVKLHVPGGVTRRNQPNSHLYETFDHSALVALGTAWEDMVTASLLPLARQHVARCRKLEQKAKEEESAEGSVDAFHEWTLPPEQAIWKIAQEGVESEGLSSARPPTRIHAPSDSESSSERHRNRAILDWCQRNDLDPSFVRSNMDVYGTCIQSAPVVLRPELQTDRDRDKRREKLARKRRKIVKEQAQASGSGGT